MTDYTTLTDDALNTAKWDFCAIIEGRNDKAAQVLPTPNAASNHLSLEDMMATSDRTDSPIQIQLTKGYVALVDECDADLASSKWFACKTSKPYAAHHVPGSGKRGFVELMHRIVASRTLGRPLNSGEQVDHIDGDVLNNRRANLRIATNRQNGWNAKISKRNTSGYKGVSWQPNRKKWRAQISIQGVHTFLGEFFSAEEAHAAYCEAAKEHFGEFVPMSSRMIRNQED